jgi:hypothetical protein
MVRDEVDDLGCGLEDAGFDIRDWLSAVNARMGWLRTFYAERYITSGQL